MAYSITKPNIYFSGDKRILTETIAGSISKFNVVMTHAKDSMYYVINDSTKDTIEIAIEPFKVDTNCVLTNYIMFPNDFSGKTISFVAPDGYEIYYTGDYTRTKYTENTIIAIQHVDMGKIVISMGKPDNLPKYGVLLTLSLTGTGTMSHETTVTYNPDGIDTSKVKLYWNYNPETDELGEAGENTHAYRVYPDSERIYHLLVLSNENLYFPNRNYRSEDGYQDILTHTKIIDKYKDTECLLFPAETTSQCFIEAKKLEYITEAAAGEIIDKNVSKFSPSFSECESLKEIPAKIFDIDNRYVSLYNTFFNCTSLTFIPDCLFDKINCVDFMYVFYNCTNIKYVPTDLFDICTPIMSETGFAWCFYNCNGITSNLPELWNKSLTPASVYFNDGVFTGCTNARNIEAAILSGWASIINS